MLTLLGSAPRSADLLDDVGEVTYGTALVGEELKCNRTIAYERAG